MVIGDARLCDAHLPRYEPFDNLFLSLILQEELLTARRGLSNSTGKQKMLQCKLERFERLLTDLRDVSNDAASPPPEPQPQGLPQTGDDAAGAPRQPVGEQGRSLLIASDAEFEDTRERLWELREQRSRMKVQKVPLGAQVECALQFHEYVVHIRAFAVFEA